MVVTPRRGDQTFQLVECAEALHGGICLLPGEIARGKVRADGAAVVESDAHVDRQTITDRHRVTGKCAGSDELASGRRGIAGDGLKRLPVAVDVSHASRDDRERVVVPLLGLPTHLQLVVGAQQSRAVMGHRGLGSRPHEVEVAEARGAAARHASHAIEPIRCRDAAAGRVVVLRKNESTHTGIQERVVGRRVRDVSEGRRGHSSIESHRGFKRRHQRRPLGADPELVVIARKQTQARRDLPRQLAEQLVLLILPWECRVGARLTVGIAKVLIPGEEPRPVAHDRPTEIGREVTVSGALVAALRLGSALNGKHDRLAGQAGALPVVRRVVLKGVAPLPGDNVEHGALDVAEFGGRPHRLDLHFLNDVDAGLGDGAAAAWTSEIGAIQQERVLVDAGAQGRHRVVGAVSHARWRDAWSHFYEVEHAEPASRDVPDVVGAEARLEAAASGLDARAPFDFDGGGNARDPQHDETFDGRPCAHRDLVVTIRGKAVHPYFERVEPGRQGLKSQLPFFVGHRAGRSADESRRAEGDLSARQDATLFVSHGADQRACEALCQSGSRHEQTCDKEKKERTSAKAHT